MNNFKQFKINTPTKGFEGDKIKISKVLNREIVVHRYKLEASKIFKKSGSEKCLHLEITVSGQKHVLFTGSTGLIEAIKQVPKDGFPFQTTIVEENEKYLFS